MNGYRDIIALPHRVSATRPQMPLRDRAAQFSPFAALAECNCKYTDYGIISEYGGSLFPTNEAPQQDSDFKMGGMS